MAAHFDRIGRRDGAIKRVHCLVLLTALLDPHGHLCKGAKEGAFEPLHRAILHNPPVALDDLGDHRPDLDFGKPRSDAAVDPVPEGKVPPRVLARHIKAVGILQTPPRRGWQRCTT